MNRLTFAGVCALCMERIRFHHPTPDLWAGLQYLVCAWGFSVAVLLFTVETIDGLRERKK